MQSPASPEETTGTQQIVDEINRAVESFAPERSKKAKEQASAAFAEFALTNPDGFFSTFQVLRLAISEAPDEESAKQLSDLEVHTKKSLRGQVSKLKPEEFEVLYSHATDIFDSIVEGTYRQEAEAVLGGMFDRALAERYSNNSALRLAYHLAQHSLQTDNMEAIRYASNLLSFRTPIAKERGPLDETMAVAKFDVVNDENLPLGVALDYFINSTTAYFTGKEGYVSTISSKRFSDLILENISRGVKRAGKNATVLKQQYDAKFDELLRFHASTTSPDGSSGRYAKVQPRDQTRYPERLMLTNDPNSLNSLTNTFVASYLRSERVVSDVWSVAYPGSGEKLMTYVEGDVLSNKKKIRRHFIKQMHAAPHTLEDNAHVRSFLNYVVPNKIAVRGDEEPYYDELFEANEEARIMITELSTRGIPDQGLKVVITPDFDKELHVLEVSHIRFARQPDHSMIVRIGIGKSEVALGLNTQMRLVSPKTGKYLGRPPVTANPLSTVFWETKVLKALESFVCVDIEEADSPRTDQEREFDAQVARVGHLRRLSENTKGPGADQYRLAYDELGWDLASRNAARVARGLPLATYVRKIPSSSSEPLVYYPPVVKG